MTRSSGVRGCKPPDRGKSSIGVFINYKSDSHFREDDRIKIMRKILSIGPFFVIIAALLWSLDGLLRQSLYSLPPAVVVFWEHVVGLIILTPFVYKNLPEIRLLSRREWVAILAVGLFSGALGTIFYTAALGKVHYIQFSVVVLLQQLQPIWAISAAAIILKEKLTPGFLKWAIVAIVASYFVTFKDLSVNLATGGGTIMAAILALSAGLMWGSSTALSKAVLNKVSFTVATLLRFAFAPVFAFIILFLSGQGGQIVSISQNQWMILVAIAISTGMVALLIYYYGLKKTPARVTTICELVWPASAVAIDFFYFQRGFSMTQVIGIAVMLYAIYRVSGFKK